jgi:hypothetical protein
MKHSDLKVLAKIIGRALLAAALFVPLAWAQKMVTRDSGPFLSGGSYVVKIENKTNTEINGIYYQSTTATGASAIAEAPTIPPLQIVEVSGTTSGAADVVVFGLPNTVLNDLGLDIAYLVPGTSAGWVNIPQLDMIPGLGVFNESKNLLTRVAEPLVTMSVPLNNPSGDAQLALHNYSEIDRIVTYALNNDSGTAASFGTANVPAGGIVFQTLTTPGDFSLQFLATSGVDACILLGNGPSAGGQALTDIQVGLGPGTAAGIGACYEKLGCVDKVGTFTKEACKTNSGLSWRGPGGACESPI